jgi:sugar/nucleoside kinase (ribokinase family)
MELQKFDIAVVGELNPDLIISGDVIPEFGQVEKLVSNAVLAIGSSSAIFACGAAKLGMRVAFIGKVGNDIFGRFMRQSLLDYGIEICGIVEDKETPTGISIILSTGIDRAILTYLGTIPRLEYSDIDQELIMQARHLHVGSYYMQEALRPDLSLLFNHAHEHGLSVSLDTNYDPNKIWQDGMDQLLEKVDIFLPNSTECCGIAGMSNLDQAVDYLRTRVKYLGVKLGEKGALLCIDQEKYFMDPVSIKVVDTVGAGDSFDAGFIYAYLAGWEPKRILKFATICGSLSTRQAGGTGAQPTFEEAIRYL